MKSLATWWDACGLQLKLQLLIQSFLIIILVGAQLWISQQFEHEIISGAQERARTVAEGAISGLNTLMVTKGKTDEVISDEKSRALFIQEMGAADGVREMRVVRGKGVDAEFGEGLAQERPTDEMDRSVLNGSGKTEYRLMRGANGDASLRAVLPYIAAKTGRATNCLKCHGVSEGSVIGAASVTIDVKDDLASLARINLMIWLGQVFLQALLFFVIGIIVRRLLRQLGGEPAYVIDIVTQIAGGNLSSQIATRAGDQSSLLAAMKEMQGGLRLMISGARDSASQLKDASRQLVGSSRQVLNAAERESDASNSVAAAVEEMTVCIGQISDNANNAQHHAGDTGTLAKAGAHAVQDAIAEMDKISLSVNASSSLIATLGERSQQISRIVNVIKEIADQTNLLALNAAIEAARAGEQGRGFAVVADEVRKLAERTTQSTREIATMVQAIQDGTAEAIAGMKAGGVCVREGVRIVGVAGESMDKIQQGVDRVLASVDEISGSLREQSATSHLIAQNVEEFARMADETGRVIRDVSASAEQLDTLASTLQHSVGKFSL